MPIRDSSLSGTKTESPVTSNSKTNDEDIPSLEPVGVPSPTAEHANPEESSSHKITSPVIPLMGMSRATPQPIKLEHRVGNSSVRQLMSNCITYVGPQLNFNIT